MIWSCGLGAVWMMLSEFVVGRTLGPVTGKSKMVVSRFTTHAALGEHRVVCYPPGRVGRKKIKLN